MIQSSGEMDQIINDALIGAIGGHWDELKLLLHPYMHLTPSHGLTLRGRTNVLNWFGSDPQRLVPPARFELRDGQIYRWWSF